MTETSVRHPVFAEQDHELVADLLDDPTGVGGVAGAVDDPELFAATGAG